MTNDPQKAMRNLKAEVNGDLDSFFDDLFTELKRSTPVQSGQAKRGWKKRSDPVINGRDQTIIDNKVPYIGVLDTGTSSQAPNGIIVPAVKKIMKKYK